MIAGLKKTNSFMVDCIEQQMLLGDFSGSGLPMP
jgi:hypothetical protein